MPWCVLRYCTNNSKNVTESKGIAFHRFPGLHDEQREKWIKFVQKNRSEKTWLPSKHSCICSLHFREEHKYDTKTGRRFLKKDAVPYEEPPPIHNAEDVEPISEVDSDTESILDTPKEIALKHKLNKLLADKKRLTMKIKMVQRKNLLLKRKCDSLTTLTRSLKNKIASIETRKYYIADGQENT